jgi:hypothetical protein
MLEKYCILGTSQHSLLKLVGDKKKNNWMLGPWHILGKQEIGLETS